MDLAYRLHSFLRPTPPAPGEGLRLGIWQGTGTAATPEAVAENLERLETVCGLAAAQGVQLLAFPELYLSGYIVTPELARRLAEPVDGPSLQRVAAAARREWHNETNLFVGVSSLCEECARECGDSQRKSCLKCFSQYGASMHEMSLIV